MANTRVTELAEKLQAQKNDLSNKPAAKLIAVPLSTYHSYLGGLLFSSSNSETYMRSEKSVLSALDVADTSKMYANKTLKNGDRAHAGAYKNSFERVGDVFSTSSKHTPATTVGDGVLFDKLLRFQQANCGRIADELDGTNSIKVGFYNDYPCVMVHIKQNSHTRGMSDAAFEEWVNFLISYFTGVLNFKAQQADIPVEMIRRSSFGFLSPTIAPTGESIRINLGIVPDDYVDVVIKALRSLDKTLNKIADANTQLPVLGTNLFYGNDDHKKYLNKKYTTPALSNPLQLLFRQVEKNGKTTVQNIMRTPIARDGIATAVFASLNKGDKSLDAFFVGVNWALEKLNMVKKGATFTLSFLHHQPISYAAKLEQGERIEDQSFWDLIQEMVDRVQKAYGRRDLIKLIVKALNETIQSQRINTLYSELELLNEMLFVAELKIRKTILLEDGFGSDSECEQTIGEENLFSKKLIVSNGMRAIWASVISVGLKTNKSLSVLLDSAYYEVGMGLKLMKELEDLKITLTKAVGNQAAVCIHDINACITTGVAREKYITKFLAETQDKILIVDSTSATPDRVKDYIARFAASRATTLFLVSSGLKHEQLGADKNSYGTIRIVTKDKAKLEQIYSSIKLHEEPVRSPVSHQMRRMMKELGAVPTSTNYFRR